MTKIVAINASPRSKWNTAQLVREAAAGAADAGNEVQVIDLYDLEPFMGCRSCFVCKTEKHYGVCTYRDGLSDTLAAIREADGLILGTPNYFGRPSAGFRALYERLVFQYLTYRVETPCCNEHPIPVLLIMTSNCPEEYYDANGYTTMLNEHVGTLGRFVGPTTAFIGGDTYQTDNYDQFNWTMFDADHKRLRRAEAFPEDLARVRKQAKEQFSGLESL